MKLLRTSIVPVELFTVQRCKQWTTALCEAGVLRKRVCDEFCSYVDELIGTDAILYSLNGNLDDEASLLATESAVCFIFNQLKTDFTLCHESIASELKSRDIFHARIIQSDLSLKESRVISGAMKCVPHKTGNNFPAPKINYVFSFYNMASESSLDTLDTQLLKLLAEPSFLGLDDMLSTSECAIPKKDLIIKDDRLKGILDCDLSSSSITFVTWATIVAASRVQTFSATRLLLTVLECRLQMVWNRCYTISAFVDYVFRSSRTLKQKDSLYWGFARALDNSRSVISATFSSRANFIFREMARTSGIDGEIDRMSRKIDLLEKFLAEQKSRHSHVYQKSINLLLFVTALASVAQVILHVPIQHISDVTAYGVLAVLAIIGVVSIIKIR